MVTETLNWLTSLRSSLLFAKQVSITTRKSYNQKQAINALKSAEFKMKAQELTPPQAVEKHWHKARETFFERVDPAYHPWLEQGLGCGKSPFNDLPLVWGCSEFVANTCKTKPGLFRELAESGDIDRSFSREDFFNRLIAALGEAPTEPELMSRLRFFRYREMARIIWRDFTRKAPMEQTTLEMSWLAEAVINETLTVLHHQMAATWGEPVDSEGNPQSLVVLGMGKLGGWELNVSSDIDLVFAYPESGDTRGGKKVCSNQEFFIKLAQKLIRVLDENTADGFVFRVDMRLRPYGGSGPLVMNFDAVEQYYQTQGRDWERYAMIKARVVAGNPEAGRQLMALLRPFTYRKYLDFSAIEALRQMKALINREVKRLGNQQDIKKGGGGIREIEFVAQAFQIIHGGRERRLQVTSLREVLSLVADLGMLPREDADALYESYRFLRNLEHTLQGWNDQQTQRLPSGEEARSRTAYLMGYNSWPAFLNDLEGHRQTVSQIFAGIIADDAEEGNAAGQNPKGFLAWAEADEQQVSKALAGLGYNDLEGALEQLKKLRQSRVVAAMPETTRGRLESFMPLLITACGEVANASETLRRSLLLVQSIIRRSAYLVLLTENPNALQLLVKLCAASPWIAGQLARYPVLLDELLDHRALFSLPDKEALVNELRQQLLQVAADDLEAQMEVLRHFKMAHSLKVAACEVTGALPLMKVSDNLTWLAEALLDQVLAIAWGQMLERYGEPGSREGEPGPEIVIIAYGKLGGIELAHNSDLDLVFIHNAEGSLSTGGKKPVDNATFFTRLGQRIIHLLTVRTQSGLVYEVDMRLRPSGNSGLLVTSLQTFEKYQTETAWTWEHQALVRARPVAGSGELARQFMAIRERVLARQRDVKTLQDEVVQMRLKMREHLGSKTAGLNEAGQFNIKQDSGGIVDIEFIVQYLVLCHGQRYKALLTYTDNMRLLDVIEAENLLDGKSVNTLRDAYIFYRTQGHKLNLQGESTTTDLALLQDFPKRVTAIWDKVFGDNKE